MIIFSLALLCVIIYFLVSPKSSRLLRLSAIIALALIGLSLGVCGIILIKGPSQDTETISLPFLADGEAPPAKKTNVSMIIAFFVTFLFISGLAMYSFVKEKGRKEVPVKKRDEPKELQSDGGLNIDQGLNIGQAPGEEDSFDIGLE